MARKELTNPQDHPELSPYESPPQAAPPSQQGPGFFGCFQNTLALIVLAFVVVVLVGGTIFYLVVRESSDATESVVGDVTDLLGGGPSYTAIEVRQLILTEYESFWLESYRQTQAIDVYASNEWPGILPGRRSLRYLGFVTVTAGVDLDLLEEADITYEGETLVITLPQPQVRDCILDEQSSRYYDRQCSAAGVVDAGCGGLEDILRERALLTAATENTPYIFDEAQENAIERLGGFLTAVGVQSVRFEVSEVQIPLVAQTGTCSVPIIDDGDGDLEVTIDEPEFITPTPNP